MYMGPHAFKIQQQIASTLIEKLELHQITWERAGQIARQIEMIIPYQMEDQQLNQIIPEIIRIPELSQLDL